MTTALTDFPPTRAAAAARLAEFAPLAGSAYTMRRNYDYGPGLHGSVSTLSPYVRMRMLDEATLTRAVLAEHSAQDAEKFLTEVFWRTYWKGWMELRPAVWDSYVADLARQHDDLQTQSGLRQRWEDACMGNTGVAPFDDWAHELVQTGYLHNHARMWFASIWIFTLKLPWQLGADFFLRHLLDGDAAVNTLSWRWVAGIQTQGKTYLATQSNISKFTNGRYAAVPALATKAMAQVAVDHPAPRLLPEPLAPEIEGRAGFLLHDDDIDLALLQSACSAPLAMAYLDTGDEISPWHIAPHVRAFRLKAAQDSVAAPDALVHMTTVSELVEWVAGANLTHIIAPYAPVGTTQTLLSRYEAHPDAVPIIYVHRALDTYAWPLATKGFFPFKKHIPDLIKMCRGPA